MTKVTMVRDDDIDATLWYKDGEYVGHDDQIGVTHLMEWLGGEIIDADLSDQQPRYLAELVR